jgi:hypothetical protein
LDHTHRQLGQRLLDGDFALVLDCHVAKVGGALINGFGQKKSPAHLRGPIN